MTSWLQPSRLLPTVACFALLAFAGSAVAQSSAATATPTITQTPESTNGEIALALKPLEAYLRGHETGDPTHMRAAFLPTAHIEGIRNGQFGSWTLDEYVALFTGKPAADEAQRSRRIDSIDISGTAAMARATLTFPSAMVTDLFVLLKVDGEWKIANKVYSSQPK